LATTAARPAEVLKPEKAAICVLWRACLYFIRTASYSIIWLTISSLMGPKMNARQQRHVGALGNTLGETQARGSPRAHPGITPAHLGSPLRHPTGVSVAARGPMLTRQNRKGNIVPSSPKFYPPLKALALTALLRALFRSINGHIEAGPNERISP
jgi:hypothetical protein